MNLNLTRPVVFFDLETTGLNISRDKIIEIAIMKIDPDQSTTMLSSMINPGIPISQESTDIHGITDNDVKDKPSFKDLALKINWQDISEQTGCKRGTLCKVFGSWAVKDGDDPRHICLIDPPETAENETLRIEGDEWVVYEKPDLVPCALCGDPSETARNMCLDCLDAVDGKQAFKRRRGEK